MQMPAFDPTSLLIGALVAGLIALLLWLWRGAGVRDKAYQAGKDSRNELIALLQQEQEQATNQQAELTQQWQQAEARLDAIMTERATLAATLSSERQGFQEKLQLLQQAKDQMKAEFQQLSADMLAQRSQQFSEQSQKHIGDLLDPLKSELKQFKEQVQKKQEADQFARGQLLQQITQLHESNRRLNSEAKHLAVALKGESRVQGSWGEMLLERALESVGLTSPKHFETQTSHTEADGSRKRPDVLVHLPEQKDVIIDAKVSLTAYERACAAEESDKAAHLAEHVASLKRHIDQLSKKDYSQIKSIQTLDFVMLFVPIEAALLDALRLDPQLFEYAAEKNIGLVTPSTLLVSLRTIAHLWQMDDRNSNALEIARQAGALYDKFVGLEKGLRDAGQLLRRAADTHDDAVKRISTGRGNLVGRIEKLRDLGADARKRLPPNVLEAAQEADAPDLLGGIQAEEE